MLSLIHINTTMSNIHIIKLISYSYLIIIYIVYQIYIQSCRNIKPIITIQITLIFDELISSTIVYMIYIYIYIYIYISVYLFLQTYNNAASSRSELISANSDWANSVGLTPIRLIQIGLTPIGLIQIRLIPIVLIQIRLIPIGLIQIGLTPSYYVYYINFSIFCFYNIINLNKINNIFLISKIDLDHAIITHNSQLSVHIPCQND